MHARAEVTLWTREEDGSYQAEKNGWKLHVKWTPEPPKGGEWGFSWEAEGPDGQKAKSAELIEEIEMAMVEAEAEAGGGGAEKKDDAAALPRPLAGRRRGAVATSGDVTRGARG